MDVKKLLNAAGATLGRIIQQAEEAFLDIPKTEYSPEYKENIKKVDFLIILTEKMLTDFEKFLQINEASSGEVKLIDNVVDPEYKSTYSEEFGVILQNPLEEIKLYCPLLSKNLLKVGKYQIKLGEAFKAYLKNESEIYIKKLRKMLEVDLKRFKDEEANLENLRLDHDYLKNRMDNAYTSLGKDALEKEYEKVKNNFEFYHEKTTELFKTVDSYFTTHRILLKEFVEIQRNYYRDCDKYLTTLLRKMYTDSYKITYDTQLDQYTNGVISTSDVDEIIKRDSYLEQAKLSKYQEKVDNYSERMVSIMKNGVMLIHFRRDDKLLSINETGRSSREKLKQNLNFNDKENEMVKENGTPINGNHHENNVSIQPNIISTEYKVNSAGFENDEIVANGKVNLNISTEDPKPLSIGDGEIVTPQVLKSENTAIEISDDNNIATDLCSELSCKLESNPNEIHTDKSEFSLNSSIDIIPHTNGNLENSVEFKDSVETEPSIICANTNLENLIPDSSVNADLNIDIKSESNLEVQTNLSENLSDELIQPVINTNLENTTPEISINADLNIDIKSESNLEVQTNLSENLPDELIQPVINTNLENTTPEISINIQSDSELKQNINLDENLKVDGNVSVEPFTIDNNLTSEISEPNLTLNINSNETEKSNGKLPENLIKPEIDSNLEITKSELSANVNININADETVDSNITTDPAKFDISLQDKDIKSDINQVEPDKPEGDISLSSISLNDNITVANNVTDLPLDLKEPVIEERNAIVEPKNIDINQINVERKLDLQINTDTKIGVKLELDGKEVQISDENLSLNQIKSDLTENIEISESIKEDIDNKTEINVDISSEPIKSEIILDNENLSGEVKLDGVKSTEINLTTPDISAKNEIKDIEEKSEIDKENSVKIDDVLLTESNTENLDQPNKLNDSENFDKETKDSLETKINIEPYKVETESSLNVKTEIDLNLESCVEDSAKIEETEKTENNQDINANLIIESPAQLDSQIETKEPEKAKEDETKEKIETTLNSEDKTERPDEFKTESDKINDQEEK